MCAIKAEVLDEILDEASYYILNLSSLIWGKAEGIALKWNLISDKCGLLEF